MRIIAGEAKGRHLKSPKGLETRPTADRVKESLFSIIAPLLADTNFLDLFAGTGSIGMEAISRGARKAVLVDTRETAVRVIRENLERCGFANRAEVYKSDARMILRKLATAEEKFDFVYVDPPYDQGLVNEVLKLIAELSILKEAGWVIVEARKGSKEAELSFRELLRKRQAVYGDTVLVFYQKAEMAKGDSY